MKNLLLTILLIPLFQFAHSQAYEGKIEYNKQEEAATLIDYPFSPSLVEDALVRFMDELGYKKKESKGFLYYKGAIIKTLQPQAADYIFRVERKSRKDKDESTIYLIIKRTDDNALTQVNPAELGRQAKVFLESLEDDIEAWSLEVQIREQESVLSQAEKKLKSLEGDQESMEKRLKKLQEDLNDNWKNIQEQVRVVASQKAALADLKRKKS